MVEILSKYEKITFYCHLDILSFLTAMGGTPMAVKCGQAFKTLLIMLIVEPKMMSMF
jgi:hypothetical protein